MPSEMPGQNYYLSSEYLSKPSREDKLEALSKVNFTFDNLERAVRLLESAAVDMRLAGIVGPASSYEDIITFLKDASGFDAVVEFRKVKKGLE